MKPRRKVMAFDMDGVLVDSLASIINSLNQVLTPLGLPELEQSRTDLIGLPIVSIFKILTNGKLNSAEISSCCNLYREINNEIGRKATKPYPEIPEVLDQLVTMIDLIVVTSKLESAAKDLLGVLQLDQYFKGIFGVKVDGESTTKDETLGIAASSLENKSAHSFKLVALVGDKKSDIVAAHTYGIPAIAAHWGYGSSEELKSADYLVFKPSELLELPRHL
jgi:phosphoglycolate phosphatase